MNLTPEEVMEGSHHSMVVNLVQYTENPDLSVVNSARISVGKRTEKLTDKDIRLINLLMGNHHGTPFEHNLFTFHVKCPIFVAREWFRHRIGSFNEMSGRYMELPQEYYVTSPSRMRQQVGKAMSYEYEVMERDKAEVIHDVMRDHCESCFILYESLLKDGVAKEVARQVLPMALMTQFYWSVNARSLMNFLSLRTAESAQEEIRTCANIVFNLWREVMPITAEAWIQYGRVAP